MDQVKIGMFLKELRNEKGMTQEHLAEKLNVNSRTVSRWENARTMPDLDVLIELAKYYDVSVEELLNGERTEDRMDRQTEHTLYSIAEYTNEEKERMLRNQHFFARAGVISWLIFFGLKLAGLDESGVTEKIASFAAGMAFAMSIIMLVYSGKYIERLRNMHKRLTERDHE